jgi:hypothetical protein
MARYHEFDVDQSATKQNIPPPNAVDHDAEQN